MSVKAFRLSVIHLLYLLKNMPFCNLSEGILPLLGNIRNIKNQGSRNSVFRPCLPSSVFCPPASFLSQVNFQPRAHRWHAAQTSLVCLADILGGCPLRGPANRHNGIVRVPAQSRVRVPGGDAFFADGW